MTKRAFDKIASGLRGAPIAYHIAQLRHAYSLLMAEQVKDQRAFAQGLVAPAIEHFERINGGCVDPNK